MATSDDQFDYKTHANELKDEGNEAFAAGDNEKAILLYTQAIGVDPDNHVLYSNRSAAYMKVDSISKALRDAEKCVQLAPNWVKGYNRLGAAQHGLKRFDQALDTIQKGLKLEPSNQALWTLLRTVQEAANNDKKERFEAAAQERAKEEARLRAKDLARANAAAAAAAAMTTVSSSSAVPAPSQTSSSPAVPTTAGDEDTALSGFFADLDAPAKPAKAVVSHTDATAEAKPAAPDESDAALADFFASVASVPSAVDPALVARSSTGILGMDRQNGNLINEKYASQDLGTADEQADRLVQPNYQWRNLNPFYVLQLGIDATEEDIKQRYRKLSTKVHPDKLRERENAREAFEEVKKAYQRLQDEKQREVDIMNIEFVRDEYLKERRRLISKGMKESQLPPLEEELERRTFKHFAEIEMARRRAETNLRGYNARERIQEDAEKQKLREQMEREEKWADVERREKRVGNWREFQEDPEAKKVRLANFKEEHRAQEKHGQVKLEEWKRKWK